MVLRLKWAVAFYLTCSIAFATNTDQAAQTNFKKTKLELAYKKNKKIIQVELAETQEQHAQGLMFRQKLNNNEGMLFVFTDEQVREFWMKNTLISLDIGYFDKNKKLIDIQQMSPVSSILQIQIPTYPSKLPAMYALEMVKGWFKKNKFAEGATFKIVAGPRSK